MSRIRQLQDSSEVDSTFTLKEERAQYHPFETVPPELLGYILTFAYHSHPGDDSPGRYYFPSIPSCVNRQFNRVVSSIPILWSYLRVTSLTDMTHIRERIHCRSGALPLEVCLNFKDVTYQGAGEIMEETIVQTPSRCRTITLIYPKPSIRFIPRDGAFWDHLALLNKSLQVTRLSIHNTSRPRLDYLPSLPSSIRSLELSCHINWSQMTFPSTLNSLSIQESVQTLSSATTIIECLRGSVSATLQSLSLSGIFILDPKPTVPADLRALEALELDEICIEHVATLLGSILIPNLHHLTLKSITTYGIPDTHPLLWEDLQLPNLRRLTLHSFLGHPNQLVELISNLPGSVTCFELIQLSNHVTKALLHPSILSFCNQLQDITTDCVLLDNMVALVEGRCTPLRTLKIEFKGSYMQALHSYRASDQWEAWLKTLRRGAAQLTISGDDGRLDQCSGWSS